MKESLLSISRTDESSAVLKQKLDFS